jgi:hypothetical protein
MAGSKLNNTISKDGKHLRINIDLIEFIEEGVHFFYSPALDLTGYGNSKEEAIKSFELTVEEFFRFTHEKGTLEAELKRLGWKKHRKADQPFSAPSLTSLTRNNKQLEHILNFQEFNKSVHQVHIA